MPPVTRSQTLHVRANFNFQGLPLEIREQIWEEALPPPIVQELRKRRRIGFGGSPNHAHEAAAKHPVVLRVCKESRRVALRHYSLFPEALSDAKFYPIGHQFGKKKSKDESTGFDHLYGTTVTEDTLGVRDHLKLDDDDGFICERGLLIDDRRSYIDFKRDTVYINQQLYQHPSDYFPMSLEVLGWGVRDYPSFKKIRHLAVDLKMWREAHPRRNQWFNSDRVIPEGIKEIMKCLEGFSSLETLTLVFYDHDGRDAWALKPGFEEKHTGQITLEEDYPEDSSYNYLAQGLRIVNLAATLTHEQLREAFEAEKEHWDMEIRLAKEKYPDLKIPKILWRFATRNGKFF